MGRNHKVRKDKLIEKEKNWSSREGRKANSNYFILIDTKTKPHPPYTFEILERICDEFMLIFKNCLPEIVIFNNNKKRQHFYSFTYIKDVAIKYVVELGLKNQTAHIHIALYITHHSNITIEQGPIYDIANEFFMNKLGRKPFVARPRLMSVNRVEEYMVKSKRFDDGFEWEKIKDVY